MISKEERFCLACIDGDYYLVSDLLQADATLVNCRGPVHPDHREYMNKEGAGDGWTPLHLAAHYGQFEIVKLLHHHGADTNALSDNKLANTPIMAAIAGGNADIIKYLIGAGANLKLKDKSGHDAIALAKLSQREGIAELFR
jgi:ankyrin repeat protein